MTDKSVNFHLRAIDKTAPAFRSVRTGLRGVQRSADSARKATRSWNAGLTENRRMIQQVGFQMTDFATQVAGGQSAMLAFTQQGGQMLQFFGPAGAIMAAFLAIFGSMALAFIKTGQSIETLAPALGVLRDEFAMLGAVFSWTKERLIDAAQFIINHLDQILITASLVGGYFAGRWIVSMVMSSGAVAWLGTTARAAAIAMAHLGFRAAAATIATSALTGAIGLLRAALIRLGIPALVIATGYLIERFLALQKGAGGFGEALALLADLWRAVVSEMGVLGSALLAKMASIAYNIAEAFATAFRNIVLGFRSIVETIVNSGLEKVGIDLTLDLPDTTVVDGLATKMGAKAKQYRQASETLMGAASKTKAALTKIREAIAKGETQIDLRSLFKGKKDDGKGGKGGGGGGAGGAAAEAAKVAKDIETIFDNMRKSVGESMLSGFKSLVAGSKTFADYALDVLSNIANKVIDIMMTPVFNQIAGSIAGGITSMLPGGAAAPMPSFDGGGRTGPGVRAGGADGKGGRLALLHSDETITDEHHGRGARRSGGGVAVVAPQVHVEIINNAADVVSVTQDTSVEGKIRMMIRREVMDTLGGGGADKAMRSRFGVKPRPQGV